MSDNFEQSFNAFLDVYLCGRPAPVDGFAQSISARLREREAGISLRSATELDCVALSTTLRADHSALEALRRKVAGSSYAVTVLNTDGQVVCMFGVAAVGFLSSDGCPWMYKSSHLAVHSRLFVRLSKRYLTAMLELYPWLSGRIDARDVMSIRWLEWLGFHVGRVQPADRDGLPFRPFNLMRS